MCRRFGLTLFALLVLAPAAGAQVAATDLTPGGVRYAAVEAFGVNKATFTADNPAALLAPGPSVVGGGGLRHESDDLRGTPNADLHGRYGGLRLVGEQAAFALDALMVRDRDDRFQELTDVRDAQVAFAPLDWLAVGFGLGGTDANIDGADRTFERQIAGLTLRFGWLHLGYAAGREQKTFKPDPFLGLPYESLKVDRNVTHWGVALRGTEGWRWLLAYDVSDYAPFEDPGLTPVFGEAQGLRTETTTVQTVLWNVLLGATRADVIEHTLPGQPVMFENIEYTRADVGWVPRDGLSLVGSRAWVRWFNPDPAVLSDELSVTTAVTASWLF